MRRERWRGSPFQAGRHCTHFCGAAPARCDAPEVFAYSWIGIALIFGLSADLLPGLYTHLHAVKPLLSSSLALATVSALVLNLVFRLGISQHKQLILAPGVEASEPLVTFLETQGAVWGARQVDMSFDEFNLDVEVCYHGGPMEFPTVRPSEVDLLNDAALERW